KPRLTLTPYGQINQTVLAYDDGRDSGTAIVDNNMSSSRLGMISTLSLTKDWRLGSQIEGGLDSTGSSSLRATQTSRTRPFIEGDNRLFTRIATGWLEGPLGRITVGDTFPVIGSWIPNPGRTFATDQASFFLIGGGFNPVISSPTDSRTRLVRPWSAYAAPMQWPLTNPVVLVRYDSPTIAGFKLSMAKAQDGLFDIGLRYREDLSRFAVDVSLAYHDNEVAENDRAQPGFPEFEEALVGGIGVRDRPTGIFSVFGLNYRMFDGSSPNDFDVNGNRRPDDYGLWSQLGLRRDLFGIGDTVLYGVMGYGHDRGKGRVVPAASGSQWLRTRVWMAGLNVIQELDFARDFGTRLEIYAGYRQWRGDFVRTTSASDPTPVDEDVDTLHIATAGFRLRF
ncbi:MAG: porin, partial [Pseudomonadota bacterium]